MAVSGTNLLNATSEERTFSFFAVFAAAFTVVLALAIGGAALGLNWRSWLPGSETRGSMLESLTASVYSLMSYLP